jgi:hypothetical protein
MFVMVSENKGKRGMKTQISRGVWRLLSPADLQFL